MSYPTRCRRCARPLPADDVPVRDAGGPVTCSPCLAELTPANHPPIESADAGD